MAERTGGQKPRTDSSAQPLAVAAGRALEGAAQAAYRTYLDHRPTCEQCRTSLFICTEGQRLWDAYKEARA